MKHIHILAISFLIVGCVSPAVLRAQDAPSATVNVRFRTFGWDGASSDLNYWQSKDVNVATFQDTRSIFYKYTGPAQMILYRVLTGTDGRIVRVPVVTANLQDAGPWPLLILFTGTGAPPTYTVQVLPDDLKSFPPGSYKFANYTNGPISGALGTQSFQLQPGGIQLLRGRPVPPLTTMFAAVYVGAGGDRTPVYTNNWAFEPLMRTLVFVKQSSDSSSGIVARRIIESTVFPPEHPSASNAP